MAESLRHLDLLLQLQAESFQEMLEWHVSILYGFYTLIPLILPHLEEPKFLLTFMLFCLGLAL